jgi:YebC/PmpR family DNA-binding regulatory protein
MAVEKACEFNMSQDNIKRAIARAGASGDEREIEEIRYEGYGPHALAVVVDAATDNRNRTAGELRFLFTRHEGSLGETGRVGWMFDAVGVIKINQHEKSEKTMRRGVDRRRRDIEYNAALAVIFPAPASLAEVRDTLRQRGAKISDVYLGMRAKTKLELHGAELKAALAFLDALDEHEDAARVFSNLDFSGVPAEALA